MHDKARPLVAWIGQQFLNTNSVDVLPWPALLQNMNPIEHVWDYLGRKVRSRRNTNNLMDLATALVQGWNNIPDAIFFYIM